jgi:cell division transport system permease protein
VLVVAALLSITFAALTVGIFACAYYNLKNIYAGAKRDLYVDVYLGDDVDEARAEDIGGHLRRFPEVARAEYISREAAAKEFVGLFPGEEEMLAASGDNPLPASYRVYLAEGAATPDAVNRLVAEFVKIDGVEDAAYGQEWLNGLERAARVVGWVGVAVAAVLGGAALLVVMSTIGLSVYARRDTISILKIVGASDGFVVAPFVFEGLIIGLFGGLIALGALYAGVEFLSRYGITVTFIPVGYIVAGLAGAAALAAFGSLGAVRRFLRV